MIGSRNREKGRGGGKKHPFFFLILLILFYIMTQLALIDLCWAESMYAGPNTGIQRVIDEASYGDTVFVKKGIYFVSLNYQHLCLPIHYLLYQGEKISTH